MKFTNEEISALIQIMDIATKAGGLQVAQQALPLAIKLQTMIQANDDPEAPASTEE